MMAHLRFRHTTLLCSLMLRSPCPVYLTWKLIITIITFIYSEVQAAGCCYAELLQMRNNKIIFFKCWFLFHFPNFPRKTSPGMNLHSRYCNVAASVCLCINCSYHKLYSGFCYSGHLWYKQMLAIKVSTSAVVSTGPMQRFSMVCWQWVHLPFSNALCNGIWFYSFCLWRNTIAM